jgi:hypothetical protein
MDWPIGVVVATVEGVSARVVVEDLPLPKLANAMMTTTSSPAAPTARTVPLHHHGRPVFAGGLVVDGMKSAHTGFPVAGAAGTGAVTAFAEG